MEPTIDIDFKYGFKLQLYMYLHTYCYILQIMKNMEGVTKSLDKAMASMDLEKV